MFVWVGVFEVLGVEKSVDLLLCPALIEVTFGHFVPQLGDEGYNLVDCGFCFLGFTDFFGDDSVLDDDLAVCEVLWKDKYVCVRSKGDFTVTAVSQKDF